MKYRNRGPWDYEPDADNFLAFGLECHIMRAGGGHWCGYVMSAKHISDDDIALIKVYGGIDWISNHLPLHPADGKHVLGFCCLHPGDMSPSDDQLIGHPTIYRDYEFCKSETIKLAEQVAKIINNQMELKMHNLHDLSGMTPAELAALTVEELATMSRECAINASEIANTKALLDQAIDAALSGKIAAAYRAKGVDSGSVNIKADGYTVKVNTPKKVSWDQDDLATAAKDIAATGEDPDEYITINRSVSETAWKSWPSSLRKIFKSARTECVGKPVVTFAPEDDK